MKKLKLIFFHPDPLYRLIITLFYTAGAVFTNTLILQVFCVPVFWAALLCIFFIMSVCGLAFVGQGYLRMTLYFFLGLGVPMCIYCIFFLVDPWEYETWNLLKNYLFYLIGILFFGIGLFAFLPFYFLYHCYQYFKMAETKEAITFLTGFFALIVTFVIYCIAFYPTHKELSRVFDKETDTYDKHKLEMMPKNCFSERILGIGFKYHTTIDFIDDGWRPPVHDPFLNAYLWFTSDTYYPYARILPLKIRVQYYHKLFPEEPLKLNYPCSYCEDGRGYLDYWIRDYKEK